MLMVIVHCIELKKNCQIYANLKNEKQGLGCMCQQVPHSLQGYYSHCYWVNFCRLFVNDKWFSK